VQAAGQCDASARAIVEPPVPELTLLVAVVAVEKRAIDRSVEDVAGVTLVNTFVTALPSMAA
jgi:hypothetical protein